MADKNRRHAWVERCYASCSLVNLGAESEAAEAETRAAGLQRERGELTEAIARLRRGIASLDREGRQRLTAAFERVNGHFSTLFARLFGGGRAHLALVDDADPLVAGLEIMASPPGKRLQTLSLLSGGEQALTALALIFAVFLTNPAPVCVLDEVDAPLDDANVDRFCALNALVSMISISSFRKYAKCDIYPRQQGQRLRLDGLRNPVCSVCAFGAQKPEERESNWLDDTDDMTHDRSDVTNVVRHDTMVQLIKARST
jgi:hypothetical protein